MFLSEQHYSSFHENAVLFRLFKITNIMTLKEKSLRRDIEESLAQMEHLKVTQKSQHALNVYRMKRELVFALTSFNSF